MKKQEKLTINLPYKIRKACDMSETELCRWFSLMNLCKFINHGEDLCGMEANEDDIPHSCMLKYVNTVSGDLETWLNEYQGIPFKYSLNPRHSDSKNVGEIDFVYH